MIRFETGNIVTGKYPIFCQQVNCQGKMGSGLAKQIRDKYPEVYSSYMTESQNNNQHLGEILTVKTSDGRLSVNMYAQEFYGHNRKYTDYLAFASCLSRLKDCLNHIDTDKVVAFPYNIGCGLAGGDWDVVYALIKEFSDQIKQTVVIVRYA